MSEDALLRLLLVLLAVLHYVNHHVLHRPPTSAKKVPLDATEVCLGVAASLWTLSLCLYALGFAWFEYTVPLPSWLRWAGVAAMASCFPLSSWIYRALGEHFSKKLELRADHRLIKSGPYKYVRHPMYSTLFLCAVGTCLVSANLFVLAATLSVVLVMLPRIQKEERMLHGRFGEAYVVYRRQTGGLLPRLL